jgi:alkanesulfonate monooxygenase SsuD/methylene tetrahydromethanopterin reductase-like flavin-dependent oxidoreductase (luciferase family)
MNLMSSTLLREDAGVSFDRLQAEQIAAFRETWAEAGWQHEPRVSVSRSVVPILTREDRRRFGQGARENRDGLGYLDGAYARFGRSYSGAPDLIAAELARDEVVLAADTLLLTIPNLLGVDHNARVLETIAREIAPAIGWCPAAARGDVPEAPSLPGAASGRA